MAQQTAVEWFVEQLAKKHNEFQALTFYYDHKDEIAQARAMEKEQIMKAYDDGAIDTMQEQEGLDISMDQNGEESERYYKETYNK
jgi:hypothetical protein